MLLARLTEADAVAGGLHGAPRGRLTITATVPSGARFPALIVTGYLESNPEVIAPCRFLDRVVDLLDRYIDGAPRTGPCAIDPE